MTRPNFLQSPQAWTRVQRTSIDSADYASSLEVHQKHKEPLGHRVAGWTMLAAAAFLLVSHFAGWLP